MRWRHCWQVRGKKGLSEPFATGISFGMVAVPKEQNDEDAIRHMAKEAMRRPNQSEVTAMHDFWDENGDSRHLLSSCYSGQRVQPFFEGIEVLEDLIEGKGIGGKHFLHLHIVIAQNFPQLFVRNNADGSGHGIF